MMGCMHPSITNILSYFSYSHLPVGLREVSRRFFILAHELAADLDGPELTICLRKLLEAKDAAVRAALPTTVAQEAAPFSLPPIPEPDGN